MEKAKCISLIARFMNFVSWRHLTTSGLMLQNGNEKRQYKRQPEAANETAKCRNFLGASSTHGEARLVGTWTDEKADRNPVAVEAASCSLMIWEAPYDFWTRSKEKRGAARLPFG